MLRPLALALVADLTVLLTACSTTGLGEVTVRPAMSSAQASDLVKSRMGGHVISIAPDVIPSPGNENLPQIRVVVGYDPAVPGDGARANWYAEVAGAAVIELMRGDRPADEVAERTIDVRMRKATAQPFVPTGRTDALDDLGLEDVQVESLQPLGTGLSVRATLPDGVDVDWTLTDVYDRLLDASVEEGALVEIDDPRGEALIVMGTHLRLRGGGGWWAPGQDEVFGITTLGTVHP